MRRMGIDFGTKKVGIALTDEAGVMAFPHGVLPNDAKLLQVVIDLVKDKQVAEIVIGHSTTHAGVDNPVHAKVKDFMTDLTLAIGIPIHLEPEHFSTQEALRIQGRNSQTDAAAAAIILNSFLMKQK